MQSDISVKTPMFDTAACQNVVFDAGHNNFHDILTTYAPIASLLHSDGILISRQEGLFTQESLDAVDLLIIANAMSSENDDKKQVSAFKSYESQVLIDWIEQNRIEQNRIEQDRIEQVSPFKDISEKIGDGLKAQVAEGFYNKPSTSNSTSNLGVMSPEKFSNDKHLDLIFNPGLAKALLEDTTSSASVLKSNFISLN